MLLLGVQGCGKSLAAKAVAGGFGVPLLRLDFGTLYNKYHGETERNLREALTQRRAARAVRAVDRRDREGPGRRRRRRRRRVAARARHLLTWMAERKREACSWSPPPTTVARAAAELLRKGRFDEIFFVDLPAAAARAEIFAIHLASAASSIRRSST